MADWRLSIRNPKSERQQAMKRHWVACMIVVGLAGAVVSSVSGETPDTILMRKTLGDEVTGWRTGDLDLILSAYVPETFVGHEGHGRMDPTTWRVSFSTLDEFRAFCKERLANVKYAVSRNPLYFDVRGDWAWVVTEDEGTRMDRATGVKTAFRDTTELWMLEKIQDEWKITRFVRHLGSTPLSGGTGTMEAVSGPLKKEAEGWTTSKVGHILSVYDSDAFVGLEAYRQNTPTTWKITFKAFDEWKAFCTKRLDRTQYEVSGKGKTVYVDVKGDQALAVTQRTGKTTHREAGITLTFNDYDLWMLKKIGGQWKITGFIRRLPLPE